MGATRRFDDAERRSRLVARHHLRRTAASPEQAVRDLVAVHSSDPITPPLAMWARVAGAEPDDLDRALYVDRTLWRFHAMRRTLFVVHVEDAPMVLAAATRGIAAAERRRVEGFVAEALPGEDAGAWLGAVAEATLAVLADGEPRRTRDLREAVDELSLEVTVGSGRWSQRSAIASRVLFLMAMAGRVVRAEPAGSWISSQYRWAERTAWFGDAISDRDLEVDEAGARAQLVAAYLRGHGPATTTDVRWWTGWGARVAAAALDACGAVEVELDDVGSGWVLADDLETDGAPAGGVALLPGLDPTVMGWKQRRWYLGAHADRLFDRNGNAGPTVWVQGRVVGGWAVRPTGEVATELLEDVGSQDAQAVAAEAAALTDWLGGVAPTPRFRAPLERELAAGA